MRLWITSEWLSPGTGLGTEAAGMRSRVRVAGATAAFTALFGIGTGIGAFAGHDQFAGFPHAAWAATAIRPGPRSWNASG